MKMNLLMRTLEKTFCRSKDIALLKTGFDDHVMKVAALRKVI